MKSIPLSAGALAFAVAASSTFAAQQPDAGRTVQELKQSTPKLPAKGNAPQLETPAAPKREHGGKRVTISSVTVSGNASISSTELLEALGNPTGKNYDMAGLKELADNITAYYHAHDFPFAKAYVPAQTMSDGKLEIKVVEGHYGTIKVEGPDDRVEAAQIFLNSLNSGDVIEGKKLERASLILDDQPGYTFLPTIRPGNQNGTGDLKVIMKPGQKVGGSVGADTYGNRYTGRIRGTADAFVNSPFMFGDRASISAIYTEESMWYGSANYSAPLGYSGLRGNVGYSHTYYELGKDFKALDAHGTAKIASTGLSYPLVRSQQTNLNLSVGYQHKWLKDQQTSTGTDNSKNSDVLPVTVNFDNRDTLGGGGVTYGSASWTHGVMDLGSTLRATDQTTAHTNGVFNKLNVDVARLQATPVEKLTLFGRAAGQITNNNLDSSEDFGLGGPEGVRAYPAGEGYGDEGWLAQAEARYAVTENVTPYAFYDYGFIRTNHNKWTAGDNDREIGGPGIGVRANYKGWSADASAAWRTKGGKPQSDSKDSIPQMWLKVGYSF